MHWGWGDGGFWWFGMLWMMLLPVLVLVGIILLVVWLARAASRPPAPSRRAGGDEALEVARLRYARGEITREQYLQMVADLGGASGAQAPPGG